jgi:hypothetical protein
MKSSDPAYKMSTDGLNEADEIYTSSDHKHLSLKELSLHESLYLHMY